MTNVKKSSISEQQKHKWGFVAKFRSHTFSWKGTQLASSRLKEALTEIKKIFISKILCWP
ncbi:MAG: hypothetical protein HQK51_08000 [Oligoflexia bacterium]|nr:hypothetical protein [Oligoflexia bacterium]